MYDRTIRTALLLTCAASAPLVASAQAAAILTTTELFGGPRFSAVLLPEVPPYAHAAPYSIGPKGEITGYASTEPWGPFAVAIRSDGSGGLTTLPAGDPTYGYARGQSGTGLYAGGFGGQPALWSAGTPTILPVLTFSGSAFDVNSAGLVAGSIGDWDWNGAQHCVWTSAASVPTVLKGAIPGLTNGVATAVNEAGQIAGTSGLGVGTFYAARWDSAAASPLQIGPLPGAVNSDAADMNEHGDVVGRSSWSFPVQRTEAFLYDSQSQQLDGLGFLPGGKPYSEARGLNDDRWVVGSANAGRAAAHATLWIDGLIYDLNALVTAKDPAILYLQAAVDVNARGQIAAEAVVAGLTGGSTRIAVLTPVP